MTNDLEAVSKASAGDMYATLRPQLDTLDEIRHSKRREFMQRKRIGIPAGIVLIVAACLLDYHVIGTSEIVLAFFIGFALVVGFCIWITIPKNEYIKAYKDQVMPEIARMIGDLRYAAAGRIPMEDMEPSKIIPAHDKYYSEDYFIGFYKGCEIRFAEMHLIQEQRDSDDKKRDVTVFNGLGILIGMEGKEFSGHTIVTQNIPRIFRALIEKSYGLKRADMVDPEFEKMFEVFTNDQVEARYLIDPVIIERLKELARLFEAKSFSAAYYDRRVLILMPSRKNYFEPPHIDKPAVDADKIAELRAEVTQIMGIVDYLKTFDRAEHA